MYKPLSALLAKIAIDIGTTTTRIAIPSCGVVLCEATAVAVSENNKYEILAVGNDAIDMCGRTPSGVNLVFPLKNGAIADFSYAEFVLRTFIERSLKPSWIKAALIGTKGLLCVPACITEVEHRALISAARHAGIRSVYTAKSSLCAAIGAKLPYASHEGSMIVDIGGGRCDCAVIVSGGIAQERSVKVGGVSFDCDIINHIRRAYALIIGGRCAERLKKAISTTKKSKLTVHGLCIESGLPRVLEIDPKELVSAMSHSIAQVTACVCDTLSETPPELASDIMKHGIVLSGGGAYTATLKEQLESETKMRVTIADDPRSAAINGALCVLTALCEGRQYELAGGYSVEAN